VRPCRTRTGPAGWSTASRVPKSWFEDFGRGQLDCGQADVTIDRDFAAIANLDDYHVFVTVYDQHNDLMVSDRTPAGFRV
jgi:hypothetical protein